MRKLTIQRRKSFVGCLSTAKVYIEDKTSDELVINGVCCRKLGTLKNNEEKTFEIPDDAARIFVIADRLSKQFCNECYPLPEGCDDITLSGQNQFNLAAGNAFRFDGNADAETLQNRKAAAKKGLVVLIVTLLLSAAAGYFIGAALFMSPQEEPKVFSENGMSITLTNRFRPTQVERFTNCYDSADVSVMALKESFETAAWLEDYTKEQYGELVLQTNGLTAELTESDGLMRFVYEFTNPDTNDTYTYFSYIYKADDAFWLVQFATLSKNADDRAEAITKWAKSVTFP